MDPNHDPSDPLSDQYYSMATELSDELAHCFAHLPAQAGIPFELDFRSIAAAQDRDAELNALKATYPLQYVDRMLAPDVNVCCYSAQPEDFWKVYLPNELLENAVRWYHLALSHLGSTRVYDTMSMHFYNPKLKFTVEDIVSKCDPCQRFKLVGRGHGELAPREAALVPWDEVAVDCIGPWTLKVAGHELRFIALTIIDTVTSLTEIVRLQEHTAVHTALMFENTWLSRYPRPSHCLHDQGGEFMGYAFQQMLLRNQIQQGTAASKNPQANAICERMHQVVGNSLRVLSTMNPPAGITEANQLVDTAIANAMFAHRAAYSSALKTTPGGLAFGHDMIMSIPLIADLQMIQAHRQQLIDKRLITANQRRFSYDYRVGQQVLKLKYKPAKLEPRAQSGPHTIEQVHANGSLTIRISPNVVERITLRRVKPYRQ
jgi:transposase InsO family protein